MAIWISKANEPCARPATVSIMLMVVVGNSKCKEKGMARRNSGVKPGPEFLAIATIFHGLGTANVAFC